MSGFQFERECRTLQSESFIVELDEEEVGRADIHFSPSVVYATLCVAESLSEEDVRELISEIDERLVMSWDPLRDDFIVTVWAGREVGVFSETGDEDDEDDEDEDDEDEGISGNR